METEFECVYTYDSSNVKGNKLSPETVRMILEGKTEGIEMTRDAMEIINHNKAFNYMRMFLKKNTYIDEDAVKEINAILVKDLAIGGIYRNVNLIIPGRKHVPPSPEKAYYKIKKFFNDLPYMNEMNTMEKAVYAYAMFVKIHPFVDGNSRTGKLIMNYVLMKDNFLPIYIPKESYMEYVKAFELFASDDDMKPLTELLSSFENAQLDKYIKAIDLA
ncbi:MAG: Fic family protein [Clostridia bacterium]